MKPFSYFSGLFVAAVLFSANAVGQDMQNVPDGNYLVTVEVNGKAHRLNLRVEGNRAKCVKSDDPALANVEGQFQPFRQQDYSKSIFLARFRGGLGSQLWIFRPDGSAAVREVPDRGEQQSAVPVKGDSLDAKKK